MAGSSAWGETTPEEAAQLRASLGELLSRSRRRRGWSQAQLARRSGVSSPHISHLERGRRRPRPTTLKSLATALDPDNGLVLFDELVAAAGELLRPDTPRGSRRRERRERRAAKQLPELEARLETLTRKAAKLHAELAARRVVDAGVQAVLAGQPRQVDETQGRLELAAIDRAFEAQLRQADAAQWDREQKMMRGEL